jgi:arabinofuranan 3-O-arabinosyltransferase
MFLGILSYKPQFGLLFPFALLASRNWRVLASATAASTILAMTAAVVFGYQGWSSFMNSLVDRDPNLSEVPGYSIPLVSVFGFLQSSGVSERMLWTVHFSLAAIVVTIVCAVWAKPFPHSLKAAALSIGSTIVTPYVLGYDLCILSIGVAFLVKDGLSRGFLHLERAAILICCIGLILLSGPVPAIISIVLLVLVLRRALCCAKEVPMQQPVLLCRVNW